MAQDEPSGLGGVAGVSFDAAGTLLHPREPVARVYCRVARAHGLRRSRGEELTEGVVAARFVEAFSQAPGRQLGDGRPFWRAVVAHSLGVDDEPVFEALYAHYAAPEAWRWTAGAPGGLRRLRAAGLRVGLLSNWDARLVGLLAGLGAEDCFDAVCVSGLMDHEKPHPQVFLAMAGKLGMAPEALLHVGDSRRADVAGARAAGLRAWHWTGPAARLDRLLAALGVAS